MSKVEELNAQEIGINYDFSKAMKLSEYIDGIFPGNNEIKDMLGTILKINDNRHVFLSANKGTKAVVFLKELLEQKWLDSKKQKYDWCYIYNFKHPDFPQLIKLEDGKGKVFKRQVEISVDTSIREIKKYFSGKEIKELEKKIKDRVIEKGEKELENLKDKAKKMGFSTHITEKGVFFIPIINGKKITEEDYDNLDAEQQELIIKDLDIIEKESEIVMEKIKKIKRESKEEIASKKKKIIKELINKNFNRIDQDLIKEKKIEQYIIRLKRELFSTLGDYFLDLSSEDAEQFKGILKTDCLEKEDYKYKVNVLNTPDQKEIPVIYADKFSYYELFGKIEYKSELGIYSTNFTLIKPGLMHMANGGYLILNVRDIIDSKLMWDKLKKCITEKSIYYENIREYLGALPIKTIKPEKMPLDIKVILIGEEQLYKLLYEYDPEFKEIFSYHLVIDETVNITDEHLASYIAYFRKYNLTKEAIEEIINYAIRLTGNKKKITTRITELDKIINVGCSLAKEEGESKISISQIISSENEIKKFNMYYDKLLEELINKEQLLIDVEGKTVGQINGLSVSNYVDYEIARPVRITATTHKGKDGIISIEKENKLNGKIFGKGISVLTSYLKHIFLKEKTIGLSCSICFEQIYGMIEGDSALCAEVYAVLSSISGIPIKQNIAITGSMDQLGNVQPIGSVTKKIEGFYNVCKLKGLNGNQGVIIPKQNMEEVVLDNNILEDIKKRIFHIYTISRIEEGIPIVMDTTFEKVINKCKEKLYE